MAKKKINDDTLLQLIRDGNSPTEAARRLGVGRAAVSKRLKALKIEVTRDVTLRSAAKLVDRGMDAMALLQKIMLARTRNAVRVPCPDLKHWPAVMMLSPDPNVVWVQS
ncbi:MAG: hypothetical protein ABSF90_12485 [Syntrophobacteraceae bacterium]|jgi:predicted transcriptional regulator